MFKAYEVSENIREFVKSAASANMLKFYPSILNRAYGYSAEEYLPELNELVRIGVLEKEYVLKNLHNPREEKIFLKEKEFIPLLDEEYDDFKFGEAFVMSTDLIKVMYKINEDYRNDEVARSNNKKSYTS